MSENHLGENGHGSHEHCGHSHSEVSPDDVKRHGRIAVVNGAIGALATIGSGFSGAGLAYAAEFLHDTADTLIHGSRAYVAKKGIPESSKGYKRFRKSSYALISGFGLAVAAKSGYDLGDSIIDSSIQNLEHSSTIETIGVFVLAAGNFTTYKIAKGIANQSTNAHDALKHTRLDTATSLITSSSIVMGAKFPVLPLVGGLVTGAITSWHFRPTEKNLAHQC
jgi:hypothetical protein